MRDFTDRQFGDAATLARLLRPEALTGPSVVDAPLKRRLQSSLAYRRARVSSSARGTRRAH